MGLQYRNNLSLPLGMETELSDFLFVYAQYHHGKTGLLVKNLLTLIWNSAHRLQLGLCGPDALLVGLLKSTTDVPI